MNLGVPLKMKKVKIKETSQTTFTFDNPLERLTERTESCYSRGCGS